MAPRAVFAAASVLVLLSHLHHVLAAPSGARITSLPGLSSLPSFAMYSGYVTVDAIAGRHLFYWLVESAGSPSSDPLILWLTGGPGCSSLFALTTEHGPLRITNGSLLEANPYSWNAHANVVYLESPAGVGFSYAEDGNYTTGDDALAVDNAAFLAGFAALYPEFASRDLYLAGESYAGHYVPQLAARLVEAPVPGLRLAGWIVGNPSFDGFLDAQNFWMFMALHGLTSTAGYTAAATTCNGTFAGPVSPACANATAALRPMFVGLNPYNMYALCEGPPSLDGGCLTTHALGDAAARAPLAQRHAHVQVTGVSIAQTVVPCINVTAPVQYFTRDDVRAALHVSPRATQPWDVCSVLVNYTQYAYSVRDIYSSLLNSTTLRVLVYSGDADTCVPYLGTEACMDSLGYAAPVSYRQWHYNDSTGAAQVAGYVRQYDTGFASQLAYVTVKGTGHMVPTWTPVQALVLLNAYLAGGPPL